MEILDKSLRELYQQAASWLRSFDQLDWEAMPWLEPVLLAIAGVAVFYMASMVFLAIARLTSHACFKLDRAAHWLAFKNFTEKHRGASLAKVSGGNMTVDRYRLGAKEACERRKRWRRNQLSGREVLEISERNRARL